MFGCGSCCWVECKTRVFSGEFIKRKAAKANSPPRLQRGRNLGDVLREYRQRERDNAEFLVPTHPLVSLLWWQSQLLHDIVHIPHRKVKRRREQRTVESQPQHRIEQKIYHTSCNCVLCGMGGLAPVDFAGKSYGTHMFVRRHVFLQANGSARCALPGSLGTWSRRSAASGFSSTR